MHLYLFNKRRETKKVKPRIADRSDELWDPIMGTPYPCFTFLTGQIYTVPVPGGMWCGMIDPISSAEIRELGD